MPAEFSTFNVDEHDTLELVNGIGESVVAYLSSVHPGVFVSEEAQRQFEGGEADAVMMARRMIEKIGGASSVEDVEAVESRLEQASRAGDEAASEYLNGPWRPLKAVLLRRLGRQVAKGVVLARS